MKDIFDERMADRIVIKNLLKELMKRGYMGKILVDPLDGKLYVAEHFTELTDEQIQEDLNTSQQNIVTLNNVVAFAARLKGSSAPAEAAPVDPTPAPEAPVAQPDVQPEQPQPVAEVAPTDQPPAPVVLQ